MPEIKCILLDIEGTVCPISFVKETLFPYALSALPHVLETQWNSPALAPYLEAFPNHVRATPEALRAHVEDLTRRDVKVAALKNLQGYLWEDGYTSGEYVTPLFRDVVPALRAWKNEGKTLAIYSSGSVFAQKLLFAHVQIEAGEVEGRIEDGRSQSTVDLTDMFKDWFDTTNAGLKTESSSYSKIAKNLGYTSDEVLFLSDNVKEVDAASVAGMQSIVVDRPGNATLSGEDEARYKIVESLSTI